MNSIGEKSKIGFYAGVFMNAPISSEFSIQPEVVYSQQGAKFKDMGNVTDRKLNLGYINVPVMVQYNATRISILKLVLNLDS